MTKSRRYISLIITALVVSTLIYECAFAFGKITVDPNTGGSPAPKAPADARVAQKVTYEARYVAVQQILEDLTDMTGIKLYAGSNKNDWPVRNRKMNIFVKDVRMADLMNSIAHVMKFKWSRNDDVTPPTYRLVVDGKAAAAADAMINHANEVKDATWRKKREEWVEAIKQYGVMSQSEIELLRMSNPVVYRNARYGAVKALRALFAELPEAQERYLAGRSFRISMSKLSSETQELLYSAGSEFCRYLQDIKYSDGEPIGYGDSLKLTDKFDVASYRLDQHDSFTPGLRWWGCECSTGVVAFMGGTWDKTIADLNAINDDWSKYKCARQDMMWDGKMPATTVPMDNSRREKLENDLIKEEEALYPSEPLNEHPNSPELENTIKLKIEAPKTEQNPELAINSYIASFQKALADTTGFDVVSDSWANIQGNKLPDQEAMLGDLLDKISEQYNYNWDKSSTILEFRHRKWWKNRLNQISDDLVATWSENTRKNGFLSLDDLAQISTLTYYQAEESLKPDKVLGTAGVYGQILEILDTNGNLQWLRLYSTLNSQQRTYLADRWVSGAMLTPDQWKLAEVMFDRIDSLRSDALFSLRNADDNALRYEFREFEVTNQDGDNPAANEDRKWRVTLPKYTPPASPKKAAN